MGNCLHAVPGASPRCVYGASYDRSHDFCSAEPARLGLPCVGLTSGHRVGDGLGPLFHVSNNCRGCLSAGTGCTSECVRCPAGPSPVVGARLQGPSNLLGDRDFRRSNHVRVPVEALARLRRIARERSAIVSPRRLISISCLNPLRLTIGCWSASSDRGILLQ